MTSRLPSSFQMPMCDLVLIVWSLLGLCVGILTYSMHEERAKYPAHAYIAPRTTDFQIVVGLLPRKALYQFAKATAND